MIGNKNRKNGARFEREFSAKMYSYGWWVHCFTQSNAGQPCDVIAVKGNTPVLIDCKVVSNHRGVFELSRIEENQRMGMTLWHRCGNKHTWFAILYNAQIFMFTLKELLEMASAGHSSVQATEGMRFEEWILKLETM